MPLEALEREDTTIDVFPFFPVSSGVALLKMVQNYDESLIKRGQQNAIGVKTFNTKATKRDNDVSVLYKRGFLALIKHSRFSESTLKACFQLFALCPGFLQVFTNHLLRAQ